MPCHACKYINTSGTMVLVINKDKAISNMQLLLAHFKQMQRQ